MTDTTTPPPAVGQVWQDADPRARDRFVRIEEIGATHAHVRQVARAADGLWAALPGVRRTRIRLDRLRPTSNGYRLVEHAAAGGGA